MIEKKEIVILLHGFLMGRFIMYYIQRELEKAGFQVENIGYKTFGRSINDIKTEAFQKIKKRLPLKKKVHFVGHSLGGLLIRAFLEEQKISYLGNVVLLGSPSRGSEVVDCFKESWWFSLLGTGVLELGTKGSVFLNSLKKPYYSLGVIAGDRERKIYKKLLKDPNDGLVKVESTKIEGMSDCIVLNFSHSQMLYKKACSFQIIYFLENGEFKKETQEELP